MGKDWRRPGTTPEAGGPLLPRIGEISRASSHKVVEGRHFEHHPKGRLDFLAVDFDRCLVLTVIFGVFLSHITMLVCGGLREGDMRKRDLGGGGGGGGEGGGGGYVHLLGGNARSS